MDALVAVLGPEGDPIGDGRRMLDALWPAGMRQDASFEGPGIVLTASRAVAGAASLGPPQVHPIGRTHAAVRFDWPTLAGPAPTPWIDPTATPDPQSHTSIAWDETTATLLVLRDAMGESPVWYASQPGRFAVTTCPATLRALPWVSSQPDPLARQAMEHRIPLAPAETGWRDLQRLPPGHLLIVCGEQVEVRRWWELTPARCDSSWSDEEWFARIRAALEQSVTRRLPATGMVGAHLSGGLDSTAVALLAARALAESGRPLHTFSHLPAVRWNPPQPGDESPYVEAALARMPNAVSHIALGIETATTGESDEALLPHDREVQALAQRETIVTLLSGWGGDEGVSFNGDGHVAGQLLRGRLCWVLQWCRQFGGGSLRRTARTFYYKVIHQQLGWLAPTAGTRPRGGQLDQVLREMPPETRRILGDRNAAQYRMRQAPSGRKNQLRLLRSSHLAVRIDHDAAWSLPAGFGIRYPLLDPGLLSLVCAAPERLFVLGGRTRTLIKRALDGIYPDLIQRRHGKFGSHPRPPVLVDR